MCVTVYRARCGVCGTSDWFTSEARAEALRLGHQERRRLEGGDSTLHAGEVVMSLVPESVVDDLVHA